MSRIAELGEKYENLSRIIEEYDTALSDLATELKIEGKKLEFANRENPVLQNYYDQRRIELYTLTKYMESRVAKTRANLYKSYIETYNRDLSDRAIEKYIDGEKAYLDVFELYLEVEELYKKYQGVVDAFTSRGYALNNITKIRVASLEDVVV